MLQKKGVQNVPNGNGNRFNSGSSDDRDKSMVERTRIKEKQKTEIRTVVEKPIV